MGHCYSQQFHQPIREDLFSSQIKSELKGIHYKTKDHHLKSNKEILKRYKVCCILGSGLFSKVVLVKRKDKKKVALKIIDKKKFFSTEVLTKFLVEKQILKQQMNPNILKLYSSFQTKNKLYYELEYASKGNILDILNSGVIFTVKEIRDIVAQIISALFSLHKNNLIYGDLKAENVLIGDGGQVKLCDFNLSGTQFLLKDSLHGTLHYISPEMITNKKMELLTKTQTNIKAQYKIY